jgi:hypothetical protein
MYCGWGGGGGWGQNLVNRVHFNCVRGSRIVQTILGDLHAEYLGAAYRASTAPEQVRFVFMLVYFSHSCPKSSP